MLNEKVIKPLILSDVVKCNEYKIKISLMPPTDVVEYGLSWLDLDGLIVTNKELIDKLELCPIGSVLPCLIEINPYGVFLDRVLTIYDLPLRKFNKEKYLNYIKGLLKK